MSLAEMYGQPWMLKNITPLLDSMTTANVNYIHDAHKINMSLSINNNNPQNMAHTNQVATNYHLSPYTRANSPVITNQKHPQIMNERTPVIAVPIQNRNSTNQKSSSVNHQNHSSSKNSISLNNISNVNLVSLQAVPSIQFLEVK